MILWRNTCRGDDKKRDQVHHDNGQIHNDSLNIRHILANNNNDDDSNWDDVFIAAPGYLRYLRVAYPII